MTQPAKKTFADLVLPPRVVTKVDLSRLVTEFERVDNDLTSAEVRAKANGQQAAASPVMSDAAQEFLTQNQLTLGNGQQRSALIAVVRKLKDTAPIIHMTFAVTADTESLQQLVQWVRQSVHPQAVISVGLQPALIAGVALRTPNHIHDLSLRAKLTSSHGLLVKELEALHG